MGGCLGWVSEAEAEAEAAVELWVMETTMARFAPAEKPERVIRAGSYSAGWART